MAERAVEADAAYWNTLVAAYATNMISCHDIDGNYLFVTPSCKQMLGYEPTELIGHSAYEFFCDDDLRAIHASHNAVKNNECTTIAYRIRKKDGSLTWFETTSRKFGPSDGLDREIIYATSRDVAQRVTTADLGKRQPTEEWLTVCAWSGRVKQGDEWLSMEEYLKRRFSIRVTHGMSPEVYKQLFNTVLKSSGLVPPPPVPETEKPKE